MTTRTFTHHPRDMKVKARVYILRARETVDAHVLLERIKEAQALFDAAMSDSALDAHTFKIVVETNPHGTCCVAVMPEQTRWSLTAARFKETDPR